MATEMNVNEDALAFLADGTITESERVEALQQKSVIVPSWTNLKKEYDPLEHPVFKDPNYLDIAKSDGTVERMTRIGMSLQKLAAERMTELVFGIPVKRIYKAVDEKEKAAAKILENIFTRNRIDSLNIERGTYLYAGCEFATLWYAIKGETNNIYGEPTTLRLRSKTYSPMNGDMIYPLFDEYDDLIALSFMFSRTKGKLTTQYFDTYTADKHLQWQKKSGGSDWEAVIGEAIALKKIPAVYCYRPTPIWESASNDVYEIEWTLSRNGNYIRKNGKPLFVVFADEEIDHGTSKDNSSLAVKQYPKGSSAQYVTWEQSVESIKLQIENLYRAFFTQLQLPDMSFDTMKTVAMSGESRKMMFIDAYLKVLKEKGRLLECLDREMNVIRAFAKVMFPKYANAFDSLNIEQIITPFTISDEKELITNIMTATGGKPIVSQREGIANLGWSDDIEATMVELQQESAADLMEATI